MLTLFLVIMGVLVTSAICSGTEAALFTVPEVRARVLAESKKPAAVALLAICQNMSRPIVTIVILNNVANIAGTFLVGRVAAEALGDPWLGVLPALLTFLIIVFSEIIPKTLGERYAERVALMAALPIRGLTLAFTPIIWSLEHVLKPITRAGETGPTVNEAEIMFMARLGQEEGVLERRESEIIQRVFMLADKTASDLMTPRVLITYLEGTCTLADASEEIINSQHTRILVKEGDRDKVTGVVRKHELLAALVHGPGEQTIADLQHKVRFVPEAMRADQLLEEFQKDRQHLAVVMDEYGGVAGVITLEDVLEIITGEIVDETDRTVDLQEVARRRGRQKAGEQSQGEA